MEKVCLAHGTPRGMVNGLKSTALPFPAPRVGFLSFRLSLPSVFSPLMG
jgi:hypothetical protein